MNTTISIATQFAKALDEEDYKTAIEMISTQCEYFCRGKVYYGSDEIIKSYQSAGDSAQIDFDKIEYESFISTLEENSALIDFVDHFYLQEKKHTFKCQQQIEVGNDGLIIHIKHIDLPGEREALDEFTNNLS